MEIHWFKVLIHEVIHKVVCDKLKMNTLNYKATTKKQKRIGIISKPTMSKK